MPYNMSLIERKNVVQVKTAGEGFVNQPSKIGVEYRDTIKESLALSTTLLALNLLLRMKFHGRFGNAGVSKEHDNPTISPAVFALLALTVPVAEEAVFRGLPNGLIKLAGGDPKKAHWEVGVPAGIAFAYAHNYVGPETQKETAESDSLSEYKAKRISLKDKFDWKKIPLLPLLSGLFNWHIARKRGLDHAIIAHLINNAEMLTLFHTVNGLRKINRPRTQLASLK